MVVFRMSHLSGTLMFRSRARLSFLLAFTWLLSSLPLLAQDLISLDGDWQFSTDPKKTGRKESWFSPAFKAETWKPLAVPGFWDKAGWDRYDGLGWYRRTVSLTPKAGRKYALVCEGVDDNATVWVNGKSVGTHEGHGQRFFFDVTAALQPGENQVTFCVEDREGPGGLMGAVRIQSYTNEEDLMKTPERDELTPPLPDWANGAIVYEVFPRSFSAQGGFKGLEDRLSELRDLGVTVVWLMPIHPIGAKNRKGTLGSPYAVADFYGVNPDYGTLADFRSLVRAAHAMGLRIIIDLVANHAAWDNPLVTEHPDWFTKNDKGEIIAPNADWHDVADFDYSRPELRAWMMRMMAYWIKEMDIDGFRCDVAEMVPLDFWKEAREFLGRGKKILMLAEGTDPKQHLNGFDVTYAWNTYDLLGPIYAGKLPASSLGEVLRREDLQFPRGATRLRFLSNHDKNVYDMPAVQRYGVEGAKAAAVLMTVLPGMPLIYNGDEIGNTRRLDLFEKVPIDWRKDSAQFRAHYKVLNSLRTQVPSLRSGTATVVTAGVPAPLFVMTRKTESETSLTVINFSKKAVKASITIPGNPVFTHLYSEGKVDFAGTSMTVNLPAWGFWVGRK